MALQNADFVQETSTTTGTGTYNLDGAVAGFRTFVAGVGDTNTCYYCAEDGTDWEVGVGTVTDAAPDTLARTTILASSNAGAAVNWAAGTRYIRCTFPAAAQATKGLGALKVYTTLGASTWSKSAGLRGIIVECQGGGGAASGSGSLFTLCQSAGAGGYCRKYIAAASLGATETVTVGSGGLGTSGLGAAGGSTTFGAHCTACGGAGSGNTGSGIGTSLCGTVGGAATSGTINITGQRGGHNAPFAIGLSAAIVNGFHAGGGGSSFFGGGGGAKLNTLTGASMSGGNSGKAYGSGGGAGCPNNNTAAGTGGSGAQGVVIVWEFF